MMRVGFLFLAAVPASAFSLPQMLRSRLSSSAVSALLPPKISIGMSSVTSDSEVVSTRTSPDGPTHVHATRVPGSDGPIWRPYEEMGECEILLEALKYASEEVRGDRVVMLAAVHQIGAALEYASEELRGDREVVLAAVHQHGASLEYASEELRGDREVVAVVQQNGLALQYVSELTEEPREDREVVPAAVQQRGVALDAVQQRALECKSAQLQEDHVLAGGVVWAGFQAALRDICGNVSALMGAMTAPLCWQRFRLEVLKARPVDRRAERDELARECDAAEAVWKRRYEEFLQAENEGDVQAVKIVLERAEKAAFAWGDCERACFDAYYEGLCETGNVEEAEECRRADAEIERLATDARELEAQGKEQAAQEAWWRFDAFEEQARARQRQFAKTNGHLESFDRQRSAEESFDKDIDAGVPLGTTARLEALERSFLRKPTLY